MINVFEKCSSVAVKLYGGSKPGSKQRESRYVKVIAALVMVGMFLSAQEGISAGISQRKRDEPRPRDVWGHTYKRQTNLFRDSDGNGVINLYQQQDRKSKAPRGKVSRPKKHQR